ncbi:MAG: hypothetical protein O9284_13125 [Steroidobacteraceae bacterium]|nr:hypothetical protein [Steroidobacteraceae bacterium]
MPFDLARPVDQAHAECFLTAVGGRRMDPRGRTEAGHAFVLDDLGTWRLQTQR